MPSNLFAILDTASRGLEAQRIGLDVTGQNIANINTPGYSRRTLDIVPVPPGTPDSAGGGAEVATIRAQRDRLIERRFQNETSGSKQYSTIADTVGQIESALGTGDASLDTRLNDFFDSLSSLADRPTDAVARQDVLLQATSLAKTFNGTVSRLQQIGRETDQRVISTVNQINSLTDRIAKLNGIITQAPDNGASLHAQDEQQDLVNQLAALTDVRVSFRSEGGVDIDTASGRSMVIGASAYQLQLGTTSIGGYHSVSLQGSDITATLSGGSLGGLISVRDTTLPGYIQSLDEQASAMATAVNAAHTAGFDLDGNAGVALFTYSTPPVGVAGAAAALQVNPTVAANGRLIAAAGSAQAGDNQNARALAAIREARLLDNGTATLNDSWGQFVGRVGLDVQSATQESTVRSQIVGQLQSLRDQVSGVSLDEEALNLTKFQRAYEANAKLFAAVDDATQTLMNMVGR